MMDCEAVHGCVVRSTKSSQSHGMTHIRQGSLVQGTLGVGNRDENRGRSDSRPMRGQIDSRQYVANIPSTIYHGSTYP